MKNKLTNSPSVTYLFILFSISLLLFICEKAQSQQGFQRGGSASQILFEYSGRIGLGATTWWTPPRAKFHVYIDGLSTLPCFMVQDSSVMQGRENGSVSILFNKDGTSFGIFQRGLSLTNFFQGKVGIGVLPGLEYRLNVAGAIHSTSLYTDGLLSTSSFQLKTEAGLGKILKSDENGIASWVDPTGFIPTYWIPTHDSSSIYLNKRYINVGIGTGDPIQKLHVVNGNILLSRQTGQTKDFGSLNGSILFGEFASVDEPAGQWGIEYYRNVDSAYSTGGLNIYKASNPHLTGSNYNLFIRNDGNVGIGTATPQSKLAVNGKITAREIECTLDNFPDYVFDKSYSLRSLPELESYIEKNNHLPEIPSENEVKQNGLNLGNMDAALLKKVEELTLYVISLNKKIEKLEAELSKK